MDLQEIADEVSALLEAPVTIEDRHFRLLAFAAHPDAADPVRLQTILGRGSSLETRRHYEGFGITRASAPLRIPADPERGVSARLCLPARARGVVQGYLWAIERDGAEVNEARVEEAFALAGEAGELVARLVVRRRTSDRLVHGLLGGSRVEQTAAARELARELSVPEGCPTAVVRVERVGGPTHVVERILGEGGLPRRVAVADEDGQVVLVVPLPDAAKGAGPVELRSHAERVARVVGGLGASAVAVGVGGIESLEDAWRSHEQAVGALALAVADRDATDGTVPGVMSAAWDDLGVRRLVAGPHAAAVRDAVRTPAVELLLEAGEDLVATARTYLDHAGSVAATASALGLHRQSVYYRLSRIADLTGLDLADGRDRLELHLGLTLLLP